MSQRYIDTIKHNEAFGPGVGIIPAPADHFFWSALPPGKVIEWGVSGELPVLVDAPILPPEPVIYSSREFTSLLTTAELTGIYTHAETVMETRIWIDQVMGADFISVEDPFTLEGMAYLVYEGLLTQARHDAILGL